MTPGPAGTVYVTATTEGVAVGEVKPTVSVTVRTAGREPVFVPDGPPLGDEGEPVPMGMVTVKTPGSPVTDGETLIVTTVDCPTVVGELPPPGTVIALVLVGTVTVRTVDLPAPAGIVTVNTPGWIADEPLSPDDG